MVLEAEDDIGVVAQASDAESAARYVLGHKPTVLVLDLNMPGLPSLELIPKMLESSPGTVGDRGHDAERAGLRPPGPARRRHGVRGQAVRRRGARLGGPLGARGGDLHQPEPRRSAGRRAARPDGPPDDLTPREVEVLGLLSLGYMNPEIADRLVLSVRTVETHRANIQRKTGLSTRAELVAYAIENDLVER